MSRDGKVLSKIITKADLSAEVKTSIAKDMVENGLPVAEVAKHVPVDERTVFRWKKSYTEQKENIAAIKQSSSYGRMPGLDKLSPMLRPSTGEMGQSSILPVLASSFAADVGSKNKKNNRIPASAN